MLSRLTAQPLDAFKTKFDQTCIDQTGQFHGVEHYHSPFMFLGYFLVHILHLVGLIGLGTADAKVGVNKPEMLPKEFSPVIDVAGFLSASQERQLCQAIADLEKDTGFKLRILAQNFPVMPGADIKDFWQVDDQTIVFVADPTFGNMLHFNVGASVDLDVHRSFWSRELGSMGTCFIGKKREKMHQSKQQSSNFRDPTGPNNCSEVN